MPLVLATPPADAFDALKQGLTRVSHGQQMIPLGGAGRALELPAAPVASLPHPVYTLGLDDLAAGKGLAAATLTSWRYLLVEGEGVSKAAEVGPRPAGGSKFNSLSAGRAAAGTVAALDVAERLPQALQRTYEVRYLRIPALSAHALWLHGQGRGDDQILPMQALELFDDKGRPSARLDPNVPCTEAQLLAVLRPLAARQAGLEAGLQHRP